MVFRVDDGANFPEVSITGGSTVSEGANASFTVSTNETPAQVTARTTELVVAILVSEGSNSNFISGTPAEIVRIPANSSSASYNVLTTNDGAAGTNPGTITAAVQPGANYKLAGSGTSDSVTVRDDAGLPRLSIANASETLAGRTANFVVTSLSPYTGI